MFGNKASLKVVPRAMTVSKLQNQRIGIRVKRNGTHAHTHLHICI